MFSRTPCGSRAVNTMFSRAPGGSGAVNTGVYEPEVAYAVNAGVCECHAEETKAGKANPETPKARKPRKPVNDGHKTIVSNDVYANFKT